MEETFENYLKQARTDFAKVAGKYTVEEHLEMRTAIDSLLIAYDQAVEKVSSPPIVETRLIIVGWEFNDTWQSCDLYLGEDNGVLLTTDDFDKAFSFDNLNDATKQLTYLKENYNEYGWYIININ
jgi:hypothetical protein